MCCCDCLLISALVEVERARGAPTARNDGEALRRSAVALPDRAPIPRRLCGWLLVAWRKMSPSPDAEATTS